MRDSYLDVCKGGLIFLVVFGHFIERLIGWDNEINKVILSTIYLIHMPAFVFISGMFFKNKEIVTKIIYFLSILIPFQILYMLFHYIIKNDIPTYWLLRPYWVLWYLAAMLGWVVVSHFLLKTKYPVAISIGLSVLVGLSPIDNSILSIGRIFVFLPFFVIGQIHGKNIINILRTKQFLGVGLVILTSIILGFCFVDVNELWLFGLSSYKYLGVDFVSGLSIRFFIFIASLFGIVGLLLVFRSRQFHKLKSLGENSLSIFIYHAAIVIVAVEFIVLPDNYYLNLILCFIFSVITCFILKHQFFENSIKSISSRVIKAIN